MKKSKSGGNISLFTNDIFFTFQLADRMLEFVGAIDVNSTEQRVLDKLKVEKDRGITVKAQTCSLIYRCAKDGKDYLLNLIDTPGHVDFCSEVSRSISACQGVLLLVDANQGQEFCNSRL